MALIPEIESVKLTIIVPPMQRRTLNSFTHVNFSPKNARATKKVKRLEVLLKIVFDCGKENRLIRMLLERECKRGKTKKCKHQLPFIILWYLPSQSCI